MSTFDPSAVQVLLLDADDNLFGSEGPAFAASTRVTNELLRTLELQRRFEEDELRAWAAGRNFRATVTALAAEHAVPLDPALLEAQVTREREAVIAHLASVLTPDADVLRVLGQLAERYRLAAVSSSALARMEACFTAAGLDALILPDERFSAEDSLPVPTSKPDPAVYRFAGEALGVSGAAGLAVEDSISGVRSAVAAGFPVVGNLLFVPAGERAERERALLDAGAATVVGDWDAFAALLA